jgi:HK97 family phage prohead protease
MHRAYSTLSLKAVGTGDKRTFSGVASTPSTDRMGDIVEPKGAKFKLPLPLLWQHDSSDPIGWIRSARVTDKGITVEGEVATVDEPGPLKDRLHMAWQMLQSGLVKGLSIGFSPKESEPIDPKSPWGALRFLSWEWLELSAVTIPANQDASISAIKSIDTRLLAALGQKRNGSPPALGRTGNNSPNLKGPSMNAYTQESLGQLRETRKTNEQRLAELLGQKDKETGFTDEQRAEFEGCKAAVADLDDQIAVCEVHVGNIRTANPVQVRSAPFGFVKKFQDVEPKFKGEIGVKRFIAQTIATLDAKKGIYRNAWEVADSLWGKTNPTLVAIMKANVPGGGTGAGEWGAELAVADTRYTGDFVEYLYGATVFDQLPLRSVPHNVAIKGQDGAFTGYWVGESKAIPMSKGDYSSTSTAPLKVAGLTVMSNELIRDSSPAALGLAGDGLKSALAQIVDATFFSTAAAVAGVSPAGILNGVAAISTSGGDHAGIIADLKAMLAPFVTAKNTGGTFALVTTPSNLIGLSMLMTPLGGKAFPGVTATGGDINGFQIFVGDNVGPGDVILLHCSDIWKIGDLGVSLSVSNEAMIEQSDTPTGATDTPVAASAMFTSMFQEESTAIKVVRPINWGKRRTPAVTYVGNANWGTEAS